MEEGALWYHVLKSKKHDSDNEDGESIPAVVDNSQFGPWRKVIIAYNEKQNILHGFHDSGRGKYWFCDV